MALADIPKIPREYRPRINELKEKIKVKEITPEEVINNALTVLGKVTIDANGIRAEGDYGSFEVNNSCFTVCRELFSYVFELMPKFFGRKFLIKKENDYKKIKIGFGLRKSRASEKDIRNHRIPIVEYIKDPVTGRTRTMIHRLEEFAGWIGNDWKEGAILFKLAVPFSDLLVKEVLDKLNESMAPFSDQVLKKCGV